jgi:hypothetical protein
VLAGAAVGAFSKLQARAASKIAEAKSVNLKFRIILPLQLSFFELRDAHGLHG